MAVGLVFLIAGSLAGLAFLGPARDQRETEIREKGIDAKAKLIEWWMMGETNPTLEMEKACKFELEVMLEGKPPYTVQFRQIVPFRIYTQLGRGMILPVKVHPDKPERVILDWERESVQAIGEIPVSVNVAEVMKGLIPVEEKGQLKDRLRELEDARKDGLISQDEYENKRTELLKQF